MEGRSLLVSDVDGTLLGDDESLRRLASWHAPRAERLWLVYASGRSFESICESVRCTPLPAPRAVIGGVGTEIRLFPSGAAVGAWPPTARWNARRVHAVLSAEPDLFRQPEPLQTDWKVSYFLYDASPERLQQVRARLAEARLKAELIYSSNRDLDLLPAGVHKGAAAAFLARQWNVQEENVLVSGDSGNDMAMFAHGFRGVVVANAHAELRALCGPRVYQARGVHAAGVLEGWRHWLGDD